MGQSIEECPSIVDDRSEFGHWETDTILGKRAKESVLLTLTERQTRREIIHKIEGKQAPDVQKAIIAIQENFGDAFPPIHTSPVNEVQMNVIMDSSVVLYRKVNQWRMCHPMLSNMWKPGVTPFHEKFQAIKHLINVFMKNCKKLT
ncbi:hypothetical protein J2S77_002880 [Alkalibacillus salilacus]|uniref:IS30 family transposase n=1 Tax=Alkalibacillus salilacus TaxID=284582 RepID=A0ABT9VIS5_9BACI|nr:hypothetical protein [Alkalibacillus salilacus]MDQ0160873.1 hypothetical protein [Alkalibacillus salilacus]